MRRGHGDGGGPTSDDRPEVIPAGESGPTIHREEFAMQPFLADMERLTDAIRRLADGVEAAIRDAIRALVERRPDLARRVIDGDAAIDREEVRIEEFCQGILARYEPVAIDLRRVLAALKIDCDLERMGDLAVNIAERATALADEPAAVPIPESLRVMTDAAVRMAREALDAFARADASLARAVLDEDDEVDRLNREIIGELKGLIREDVTRVDAAFHLFSVSRNLERIADHATNIAEDVVYLTEGRIIRHRPDRDG